MDLQSLANLGEFVSALAVVISLIYLAFQVRQNTQSLRTENYARALDRVAAIQSQLSAHGELSRIVSKGAIDPSKLTPQQRIQMTWGLYETFGAFEFMFHAARSQALPDQVWSRWAAAVAWWLTFPGVRCWWQARPIPFTADFTSFVEAMLRDNPSDPEAAQRWRDFLSP
jgi:hypothetical protein